MKNTAVRNQNYTFSTSIDSSNHQDEFLIELFSCSEDDEHHEAPKEVIHNFDELISFFENLDEDTVPE